MREEGGADNTVPVIRGNLEYNGFEAAVEKTVFLHLTEGFGQTGVGL